LIRLFSHSAIVAAMAIVSLPMLQASAQTKVPAAPAQMPAAPSAPAQTSTTPTISAPAPTVAPFPKPNPANFTAASPTAEVVNAFLQASWGYDPNRIWQVQAILKTQAAGLSQVIVFVNDKTGKIKPSALEFYVLPDGKYIISGNSILPFGEHPYANVRALMQQSANGPYRGSASKDLELIEFADFQCPHCKEAQANMDKLAADFPKARIVFENDPIASIHPQSVKAAEYGVCVNELGGSGAFFQFAGAVFDGQDGLATPDGATLTLNSAVSKAGLDPAKVGACAATPATKAAVDASIKLGNDIGVTEVPTLVINGRAIPANAPYETLKQIVEFQAKLDGVTL
jgi:protein-disulfide isomerase